MLCGSTNIHKSTRHILFIFVFFSAVIFIPVHDFSESKQTHVKLRPRHVQKRPHTSVATLLESRMQGRVPPPIGCTSSAPPAWSSRAPLKLQSPELVTPIGWHAQDSEDWFAWMNYFYGWGGLTVMESGALTGRHLSASVDLEASASWRSVLVEASPHHFGFIAQERPLAIAVNAALCSTEQIVHFTQSNNAVDGIAEFMSPKMLQFYHPELVIEHKDGQDSEPQIRLNATAINTLAGVRCTRVVSLLTPFCVSHVHFWVLDVEGGELSVLQSVDFSALSVDVLCVEADGSSPEKDAAVLDLLQRAGYVYDGHVVTNDWFHHSSFTPQKYGLGAPRNVTSRGTDIATIPADALPPGWAAYFSWARGGVFYHRAKPWEVVWNLPRS